MPAARRPRPLATAGALLALLLALGLSLGSFGSSQTKPTESPTGAPSTDAADAAPAAGAGAAAVPEGAPGVTAAPVPGGGGPAPPVQPPSSPTGAVGPAQGGALSATVAAGEGFTNLSRVTRSDPSYWPAVARDGSFLVYVLRGAESGTDIALKRNLSGGAVTLLTSHPGVDKQPAISPDGAHVAYVSDRGGGFNVYVLATRGGMARRQVTDSEWDVEFPDWSPDGRLLAYSAWAPREQRWVVWTVDLETGARTRYVEGLYPRFSPDGKLLVFQRIEGGPGGRMALWTMDLAGSRLTQLVQPREWGAIQPRWSPDGEWILFSAATGAAATTYTTVGPSGGLRRVMLSGGTNLWAVRATGEQLTQLTAHAADDWYPCWASSGDIYFTTTRDGGTRIWKFSAALTALGARPRASASSAPLPRTAAPAAAAREPLPPARRPAPAAVPESL